MNSLHEQGISDLLENLVRSFVKEKIELIMTEEISSFLQVEQSNEPNSRNGYYSRTLDTRYGKINDLQVPRDRQGQFQTQVFEPYQRREGWLEEAVIHMYKGGMSTREVSKFIESMFGSHYSATTVSNITNTVLEDVEQWQNRPLDTRYAIIYLDGMYVKVKRQTVSSEVVYFAMGINEAGCRQVLGFYIGGHESSNGWKDVLKDLYRRGVKEVLVGAFDGLPGLEEAFKQVYPKADVQHCVVHKVRSTLPKIRVQDKPEFVEDLKKVYTAKDYEAAQAAFRDTNTKWGTKYPREMKSWEDNLPTLLTFYHYPQMLRPILYTTNHMERTVKEFRKRLKTMNSLTHIESAEKIIYLTVKDYNDTWSSRVVRGFGDTATVQRLQEMFDERYKSTTEELKEQKEK